MMSSRIRKIINRYGLILIRYIGQTSSINSYEEFCKISSKVVQQYYVMEGGEL
jgi:hypothetical protein